jgi:hypothetical protein
MKKSEIVLLWVAGLWAMACLFDISGYGGSWAAGIARILGGWLLCGLVWLSINKWPTVADGAGIATKLVTALNRAIARFPGAAVSGLGYVLAVVFLFGWLNARARIEKERDQVRTMLSRITSGQLDVFDCVLLPAALIGECMTHIKGRVLPQDLPTDVASPPNGFVLEKP